MKRDHRHVGLSGLIEACIDTGIQYTRRICVTEEEALSVMVVAALRSTSGGVTFQ